MRWTRSQSGIGRRKVNWILDADIAGFFDSVSHEWLVRFVEHRIGDKRVIRLIRKWLTSRGDGRRGGEANARRARRKARSPHPLLANIYLHYVFDLWAKRWRQHHARGHVIIVRYADDIVVGFEHEAEAKRFLADLRQRMEQFALSLHPDKTRLIEFGRFAAPNRAPDAGLANRRRSTSLGFTHICGRSAQGRFHAQARSPPGSHASQAAGHQGSAVAAHARAHPGAGTMARAGGHVDTSTTTRCPPTADSLAAFRLPRDGPLATRRSDAAARRTGLRGTRMTRLAADFAARRPRSFIPGPMCASPSSTRGKSRMRNVASAHMWRPAASASEPRSLNAT